MSASQLPEEAFGAALAGLPSVTPARLATLLRVMSPSEAWAAVIDGHPAARPDPLPGLKGARAPREVANAWREHALAHPPEAVWARCQRVGAGVSVLGRPGYPAVLADDIAPPPVLFWRGRLDVLDGVRCGIVGTRNATASGRDMTVLIATALADHGVRVVSGLARGIDGAAHQAVLRTDGAPPVAVVASGLDVVYPREHADLWERVADLGVLLSEVPPGTPAVAHRFPQRNRVIAALSDALVVVESRERGGSLITAKEAERRGVPVLAVPGSPRNPAAAGTNALIRDGGAVIVLDPLDVTVALGFRLPSRLRLPVDDRPEPTPADRTVLSQFGDGPLDLDRVAAASGLGLADAASALGRLEAAGWVSRTGGWYQRAGAP